MDPADAVRHLVGLQTQVPGTHYTALWSRLDGFDAEAFSRRFEAREFVRLSLQRATLHTVTADDCLALRPVLQRAKEGPIRTGFGGRLDGVDLARLAVAARALAEEEPRTLREFGEALAAEWPGVDPHTLGQAVRAFLPMVQTPPRGLWRRGGAARHTTAEHWLGAPLGTDTEPDALVRRYLAAFGPASAKDAGTWSGLTGLGPVFARLKDELAVFRDERGTELFDLPDAPRPDPDTPAPPRFLPEYDNLLIGHADRSRVMTPEDRARIWAGKNRALPAFLIDGFTAGVWQLTTDRAGTAAVLTLTPFGDPTPGERAAVEAEGAALLAFHAPGADHTVRWE